MPSTSLLSDSTKPATWAALAPHEHARGEWRFIRLTAGSNDAGSDFHGLLSDVASRLPQDASVAVVVPLSRCIIMAVSLPPLHRVKLQQALSGVLGDRLIGAADAPPHYAAAPIDNGRIHEAAVCDDAWLRKCLAACAAAGLRVVQVLPQASLVPKSSAWWAQLQPGREPAWLARTANGEAVEVAPHMLDAALPPGGEAQTWQWFTDPAHDATCPAARRKDCKPLTAKALLQSATTAAARWDLRQFAFAPPDGAARFMSGCASLVARRSGRFAAAALLALIVINVLGLNLYAMKQQREIRARHTEMERIVTQALPNAPRLLEPALQLEAAWQRAGGGGENARSPGAAMLLGFFAQTGDAQALTELEVSERALHAAFANGAALELALKACGSAGLRDDLQRAGVRCTREDARLRMELKRDAIAAPAKS